jgi:hypothetical protein
MSDEQREKIVGVSISNSPDLAALGLGEDHLHEMMVSMARTVLRLGTKDQLVSLAYGGDLRPGGFLTILFPLARGEDPSLQDWNGRLYSILAWPYYLDLTRSDEAELINACRFVRVKPTAAGLHDVNSDAKPADLDSPHTKYQVSRCLTRMREMMTSGEAFARNGEPARKLDARIVVGGQTAGYSGFMPGLFEEFLLACEARVPTYVVGAFGGISGALAKALLGEIAIDERFTLEDQLEKEKNKEKKLPELIEAYHKHEGEGVVQPETRYEELRNILAKGNADIANTLRNGLSDDANRRLMMSEQETEILSLLEQGLRKIFKEGGK